MEDLISRKDLAGIKAYLRESDKFGCEFSDDVQISLQSGKTAPLDLDFLILLHSENLIDLHRFLSYHCSTAARNDLCVQTLQRFDQPSSSSAAADFLTLIILDAFSHEDEIALKMFDVMLDNLPDYRVNPFKAINSRAVLDGELLRTCYSHTLDRLLEGGNNHDNDDRMMSPVECLKLAVKDTWNAIWPRMENENAVRIFRELLSPFDGEQINRILDRLAQNRRRFNRNINNVSALSLFVSVLESNEAQKFISSLILHSLKDEKVDDFAFALLIPRLLSLRNQSRAKTTSIPTMMTFSSYSEWFLRTFSRESGSIAAQNGKTQLFIEFLTELIPEESSVALNAHILRPPFCPQSLKPKWTEYVELSRARIRELALEGPRQTLVANESKANNKVEAQRTLDHHFRRRP